MSQVQILLATTTEGWNKKQLQAELTNPVAIGLCAVENNVVAAYLSCHVVCDEASLNNIITAEEYRNKGVAKLLMTDLVKILLIQNVSNLFMEVRSKIRVAISFYDGFGFKLIGRRKNFYTNPADDALLYAKNIGEDNK